jgi:hypothetical protein
MTEMKPKQNANVPQACGPSFSHSAILRAMSLPAGDELDRFARTFFQMHAFDRYSQVNSAAMQLRRRLVTDGWEFENHRTKGGWLAIFLNPELPHDFFDSRATAPSQPLAICRAAILAHSIRRLPSSRFGNNELRADRVVWRGAIWTVESPLVERIGIRGHLLSGDSFGDGAFAPANELRLAGGDS